MFLIANNIKNCVCVCVCVVGSTVRLATMEMGIVLLKQLVYQDNNDTSYLQDRHLAAIEGAREEGALLLRNYYKVWEKVHVHICFVFLRYLKFGYGMNY